MANGGDTGWWAEERVDEKGDLTEENQRKMEGRSPPTPLSPARPVMPPRRSEDRGTPFGDNKRVLTVVFLRIEKK